MICKITQFDVHNQHHKYGLFNVVNLLGSTPGTVSHLQFGALKYKSHETRVTIKELECIFVSHLLLMTQLVLLKVCFVFVVNYFQMQ